MNLIAGSAVQNRPHEAKSTNAPAPGQGASGDAPPKPRFCLSVGIVGHRPRDLAVGSAPGTHDPERLAKVVSDTQEALLAIKSAAERAQSDHQQWFAKSDPQHPMLTLVCALAEGADTIAANSALELKYALEAPLPFTRTEYEKDFDQQASQRGARSPVDVYRDLIGRAQSVLELPGEHRRLADDDEQGKLREGRAYEAAGLTILSQADLVLAVWDRKLSRGRGGTADMVAEAARAGIPVVLVDANGVQPIEVRWRDLMDVPAPIVSIDDVPAQSLSQCIHRVIDNLVRPPTSEDQRKALVRWYKEPVRKTNACLWYPLLTMFVRWPRWTDLRPAAPESLAKGYSKDAESLADKGGPHGIDALAMPYGWADSVGIYFAQVFRSAFVLNFLFAAFAVAAAAVNAIAAHSPYPSPVELVLIGAIVVNTTLGWIHKWQARWMEARELAERLRAALPLWSLGLRLGFFPGEEPSWTGWYARACVRMQGLRSGVIEADKPVPERAVLLNVLTGQCEYNQANAKRMHRLGIWLEIVGICLFVATALVALDHTALEGRILNCAVGSLMDPAGIGVWIGTALPALATATYGIRVIGDFEGIAHRSERTYRRLDELIRSVKADPPELALLRARARLAADAMLADVSNWRLSAESRGLAIPG